MPVTQVLVIYSVSQNVRRRVVVLDHPGADDSQFYAHILGMLPGEAFLYIPLATYQAMGNQPDDIASGNTVDAYVAAQLGNPGNDACQIVLPTGEIIAAPKADPIIDDHPDGFIIQDPAALVGGIYDFETQTMTTPPPPPNIVQALNDDGTPMVDENGNPVMVVQ